MTAAATLAEALEPLRADPARTAILLDVDGTLAPIVRHASDAHVPEATRTLLIQVAARYGVVACVSGRRAAVARGIVAIGSIAYIGNHGCELLVPGATEIQLDEAVADWAQRITTFVEGIDEVGLQRARVRVEDKGPIRAFHWRGAPDEQQALAVVTALERDAIGFGLRTHWGRKVLELRPPVAIDKGRGIISLLKDADVGAALYVGDDVTDVDAFRAVRELYGSQALCIGVLSEETPDALTQEADLTVEGPPGVRTLLERLLR